MLLLSWHQLPEVLVLKDQRRNSLALHLDLLVLLAYFLLQIPHLPLQPVALALDVLLRGR